MNNEKFLEQKASDMSVSELAEAIKIKSVLRTNEKVEVGDTVIITSKSKNYSWNEGDKKIIARLDNGGVCFEGGGYACIDDFTVIKQPKAVWTDITKECEFKPDSDGGGHYFLAIRYNGTEIGRLNTYESGFKPLMVRDYKAEMRKEHFKILKKSGG